jgi:lysozyme
MNEQGLTLVKQFESLRLKAYLCPAGVPTIGYGHTTAAGVGPTVKLGDVWNEADADKYLMMALEEVESKILPAIKKPINENQLSAFVSLAYNIGWPSFNRSTALKRFNDGDLPGCAEAMRWWNKANGEVLKGLVRRRNAEVALFVAPAPKPRKKLINWWV